MSVSVHDAALFAVSRPCPQMGNSCDPRESATFLMICGMIRAAVESEIEELVKRGELVRR